VDKRHQFYTLNEFAKLLRVDPCTVWRWRQRKLLRVVRVGGRVLVPATEVDRLGLLPPDGQGDE
jgi:excisionase family DNA binding protein